MCCGLELHVFGSVYKYGSDSSMNILFGLKMLIYSQTWISHSQYVRSEFVRTQKNRNVLLIKRLAYICLLMAVGIK